MEAGIQYAMGFYGEDEIPGGPYACSKCRKLNDKCRVEASTVHFKMSGKWKKQSGFYEVWTLFCFNPFCGGHILRIEMVEALPPEQLGLDF